MAEQDIPESIEIESQRKAWEKPEITEVSISDVTSSIYATSGNDGTFGFSNIS
ncbi:hypothetical protein thsps21_30810 [Pseudomonas sp. No.21]|uniref:hypothetical protein n=1 Tax=Pseudomonas TaxID=286 RepID=UPI001314F5E8|nr:MULTISPECIES: hypothetical protein [Pseudomonas]MDW3715390.1 hypothetical protein [Pseudomonas sp. 2023EL-01195]GJN49033.1 hypothetical protein TUM20249_50190 [Pseudomonas tohonis]